MMAPILFWTVFYLIDSYGVFRDVFSGFLGGISDIDNWKSERKKVFSRTYLVKSHAKVIHCHSIRYASRPNVCIASVISLSV